MSNQRITAEKTLLSHSPVCNRDGRSGQLRRLGAAVRLWPSALRLLLSDIQWFAGTAHAEVRSLCSRIGVLRDKRKMQTDRYDGMSVDLGPLLESALMECDHGFHPIEREALAGHLVPCIETLSRIGKWEHNPFTTVLTVKIWKHSRQDGAKSFIIRSCYFLRYKRVCGLRAWPSHHQRQHRLHGRPIF